MQPLGRPEHLPHQSLAGGGVREVGLECLRRSAAPLELSGNLLATRALARRAEDPRTRFGEPDRDVTTDAAAAAAAGQEGRVSAELEELRNRARAAW